MLLKFISLVLDPSPEIISGKYWGEQEVKNGVSVQFSA